MAYDFSNVNQIVGSQKLYSIFKKDFPLLLSGYYTNSEYIPAVDEELSADTQYYFLNTSYCNYPDSPNYNSDSPSFSGSLCRTGILLDDEDIRPFIVIPEEPIQSKDFYLRFLDINLGKKHNYIVKNSKSYNYMKSVIDKGVTSYYYRNCYLRQPYNDKHVIDGDYSIGASGYDSTDSRGYWNSNWVQSNINASVDYFSITQFDFSLDGDTHGWHFETNIPIFTSWEDAYTWVLTGQKNNEFILKKNTAVNFGLWIDGLNKPSYKVNWHIPSLEEEKYNFDDAIVKIGIGKQDSSGIFHHILTEKPYNDGSVRFTWYDFNDLGYDGNLLFPWLNLNAQVILEDGTICGIPTIDLREKSNNFDGMYQNNTIGEDGSNFIVNSGSGEYSDDYHEPEDDEDENSSNTDMSVSGAVVSCYLMTRGELRKLSQELWSGTFIDNIKLVNNNPIENIISLKAIPLSISGGANENITLGNVTTTASGKVCNESYSINVGSIEIIGRYGNFLDYAPFTSVNIYLPFIGLQNLDTNVVMNRTISVKYIVDCVTGSLRVKIISNGRALYEFNGSIAVDLPISASNRAQVEMGILSSGLGMVGSVASGNMVGAVGSGLAMASSQYHTQTSGTASAVLGFHDTREVFVRIDSPIYEELKDFNKTHGKMCNLSLNLSSLKGFTKVAEGIDLDNIPCTNDEKEMIREILTSGVII